MPQALTYTPVSLFELIRPPLHRRSESPEILGTEYQFNLGVTFALHTIRMKCILARTLIQILLSHCFIICGTFSFRTQWL